MEAQKVEALSRNDFAEAARLRDRLRMLAKVEDGVEAVAMGSAG